MAPQPPVRLVRRSHRQQLVGPVVQVSDPKPELLGVDHVLIALIAQRERVLEDPAGGVRDTRLSGDRISDQLPRPPEQMRMAGLVLGVREPPIRRPPVTLQNTVVVLAENQGGVLVPTTRSDQNPRPPPAGERPHPRLLPVNPPAGLIRRDRPTGADPLD